MRYLNEYVEHVIYQVCMHAYIYNNSLIIIIVFLVHVL